jgi:hypothetical protein
LGLPGADRAGQGDPNVGARTLGYRDMAPPECMAKYGRRGGPPSGGKPRQATGAKTRCGGKPPDRRIEKASENVAGMTGEA